MPQKTTESQQDLPNTDRLTALLRGERATLTKRLVSLRERSLALTEEQDVVAVRLGHIDALLSGQDLNQAPGTQSAEATDHSLADKVVELLQEHGKALHYREIAQRLQERGVALPKGKDPAANLLAHFFKDARVYRPQRGTYALRDGRTVHSVGTRGPRPRKEQRS